MKRLLLILLYMVIMGVSLCNGQSVELPDSLFHDVPSQEVSDGSVQDNLFFNPIGKEELFQVAPALTFEEYIAAPASSNALFHDFPEMPSEFYLHVLVLHLSKVNIPGLDAELARYNLMLENFSRNLLSGGNYSVPYVAAIGCDTHSTTFVSAGGGTTVYTGYLDPFEAYNRWVQERRLMRAKAIIRQLEELPQPTSDELQMSTIKLPENLLQENNFDVKVKQAGDAPPYRPYGQ